MGPALAIDTELTKQIILRLAPFHFENHLGGAVSANSKPHYPLTRVIDILDKVDHVEEVAVVDNQGDIPSLWLNSALGAARAEHVQALTTKGITCKTIASQEFGDYELISAGVQPWREFVNAFDLCAAGLTSVRSSRALFQTPTMLVLGDSVRDFCIYYALRRLHSYAVWVPSWFLKEEDGMRNRFNSVLFKAADLVRTEHGDSLILTSASLPKQALEDLIKAAEKPFSVSLLPEELSPSLLSRFLKYPIRTYSKGNIPKTSTYPIVADRLQGPFESPKPDVFKSLNAQEHRWLVELSFSGHLLPRHPMLGGFVASSTNLADVRSGAEGVSYLCPGFFVRGVDVDFNLMRPTIRIPNAFDIFSYLLSGCGYQCEVSDKGRYESETVGKHGGIAAMGNVLRDPRRRALLEKFRDTSESKQNVHDEGVFLKGDDRRYLNFAAISKVLGNQDLATEVIDDYISKRIFYRGLVLRCSFCSDIAWFSIEEVTHRFTCRRCGKKQQYRRLNWKEPHEPAWFYKLDEIVYQALANNSIVPILALAALSRTAKESFLFCSELVIKPQFEKKHEMELDLCCIPDGRLCIGEAKSNGKVSSLCASQYKGMALKIGATRVVFATSEQKWPQGSENAIDATFADVPHIEITKLAAADLCKQAE